MEPVIEKTLEQYIAKLISIRDDLEQMTYNSKLKGTKNFFLVCGDIQHAIAILDMTLCFNKEKQTE